MTDTGERTTGSSTAPVLDDPRSPTGSPTRPWRFTAVFTLIGLMCVAFAVASLTVDRREAALLEVLVGAAFILAAVVGRLIRNRQAATASAASG